MGRPTDYREEYNDQARKLCLLGHTDAELGKYFEVTETTINNWKIDYPSFFESIKEGREFADGNVAQSLYNRAMGIKTEEIVVDENGVKTITKEVAPDTTAMIFWLKNRQRKKWMDTSKHELTGKDGAPLGVKFEGMSDEATDSQ
jgi:hypothetical protein